MTDFHVQDHGSIIILEPQTTAQNWANGTVIERCYFKPVYAGIIRDGLTIS